MVKILKGLSLNFKNLLDYSDIDTVEEDGATFKENAEKKALVYSKLIDSLTIADDSGLSVEKLDSKPGVFSSRFAGVEATDEENNQKLLKLMEGFPDEERRAKFVCSIAIADRGELIDICEGECKGKITIAPKGDFGFGYDPLFLPDGYDKTFGELSPEEKNKLSHRYKALIKVKEKLKEVV